MTHAHFIGIGGSGLSAIARLLLERGWRVSGSDQLRSPLAVELESVGVQVFIGHDPANVQGVDLVIRSSAIPDDNPEVHSARSAGIPVYKRVDFLGELTAGQAVVAVAGTHGKTTTTAMIAWMLTALDQDPSYIIGGVSIDLGGNAHAGKGTSFVIEADEYDYMFHGLRPQIAVITHLEHDHPDCFPTPEIYRQAFVDFIHKLQPNGLLLVCADHPGTVTLLEEAPDGCRGLSYGKYPNPNGYTARNLIPNFQGGFSFDAVTPLGSPLARVDMQVPGEHNALNALAALAVAHQLGLPIQKAAGVLGRFTGTERRFEVIGEVAGVTIVNDYGHHPTEIRTTLAAARARYTHRRIWAIWQPHTYSRTMTLLPDFAASFINADRVVVSEIYRSREKVQNYSSVRVVETMLHPSVQFIAELDDITALLLDQVRSGDVIIVFSAGDADRVSANLLAGLKNGGVKHG
jgi:UDP-N-acetylmuramate--alanine ligase